MKKLVIAASALLIGTGAIAAGLDGTDPKLVPAGTYDLDAGHTGVAASVSHLGFSITTVRFDKVAGSLTYDPARPEAATVDISVDAGALNSGWAARDGHLKSKEFFNVAEFPTVTFKSGKLIPTGANTAKVAGDLTLLGVTKPVTLDVVFNGVGKAFDPATRIGFAANTTIKRSDFGMKTFLPMVGDNVALAINAEFTKKP